MNQIAGHCTPFTAVTNEGEFTVYGADIIEACRIANRVVRHENEIFENGMILIEVKNREE